MSADASGDSERRLKALVATLPDADKRRYALLRAALPVDPRAAVSRAISAAPGYDSQSDSLGRLTWMYLRLLVTRQAHRPRRPRGAPRAPGEPPPSPARPAAPRSNSGIADLERQRLADPSLSDDLRRSLTGQLDLLEQRVARRARRRSEARVPRRRARAHRGAGGADSRTGRALDRSRALLAAHRRDQRDARHRPASGLPSSSRRSARWTTSSPSRRR